MGASKLATDRMTQQCDHVPLGHSLSQGNGRGWRRFPFVFDNTLEESRQRGVGARKPPHQQCRRSEEHTSELQSLMRISYAVFCLKKKNIKKENQQQYITTTHKTQR